MKTPVPILDDLQFAAETWANNRNEYPEVYPDTDFDLVLSFLNAYRGSKSTLATYRSAAERLLQWSWFVANKSVLELRRSEIEQHIEFLMDPPVNWVGTAVRARFINKDGHRVPNPMWRPFVKKIKKEETKSDKAKATGRYKLSNDSIKTALASLNTLFNYLMQEGTTEINPIASIGQKSRFVRKGDLSADIKRITKLQWDILLDVAERLASDNPKKHMRTLFLFHMLITLYLRKSDLLPTRDDEAPPAMNAFERDDDGNWWFKVVGKGNKSRSIPVPDNVLRVFGRYREYHGLSTLPSKADNSPLLISHRGEAITDPKTIWRQMQELYDSAVLYMKEEGFDQADYQDLLAASPHWLRHTGISEDVKLRPKDHVKEDAGHSSFKTTEKYINAEARERHASARRRGGLRND